MGGDRGEEKGEVEEGGGKEREEKGEEGGYSRRKNI